MAKGLPDEFVPAERSYSLYEDVEYEEYWDDPAQIRQDALEQRLISDMLPPSGKRIIDVGCGYGRLASCYVDRFDEVVLYDGSLSLLRHARESIGDRATFVAGDVTRLPFRPASFDSLLTIRVLQHMQDLPKAVEELRRVLGREGRLVFSYHNKRNAKRMLKWLVSRRIADPYSLESAEVSATLISHHPDRMEALLRGAGFMEPEYRGAVVLDPLAKITERLGDGTPSGLRWAPFTGKYRLAPWLVGRTQAKGGEDLRPADSVEDLLECPACHGGLARSDESYSCAPCRREYPITDGIADFRL